jgi:hypothetical protein
MMTSISAIETMENQYRTVLTALNNPFTSLLLSWRG